MTQRDSHQGMIEVNLREGRENAEARAALKRAAAAVQGRGAGHSATPSPPVPTPPAEPRATTPRQQQQ
jgi:hypothetical protein